MTPEKQFEIFEKKNKELMAIIEKKRNDYSDADVLSNFKSISEAAKQLKIDVHTPTGYALFMVLLKVGRIANLLEKKVDPMNESIEDSFDDGINYFKLAQLCHIEPVLGEEPF